MENAPVVVDSPKNLLYNGRMKHFIAILCVFLSGCATIGEIEGLGKVGEVLRAAESTRIVLGGIPRPSSSAAVVNRTQGELRSLAEKQDRLELSNLPQTIAQIKYIEENMRSVGEGIGK